MPSEPTIGVPPIGKRLLHLDFDDSASGSELTGLDVCDYEDTIPAELIDAFAEARSTTR